MRVSKIKVTMIELRDYQKSCIDTIIQLIPIQKNILIQAATGAGKTIIFSQLCKTLLESSPNIKICVVVHLREVVDQNVDQMSLMWESIAPISVCCATSKHKNSYDQNILAGSIQSISNRIEILPRFDLLIIDEAHRIQPINQNGSYPKLIKHLQLKNDKLRIVGFTATPYRLGHGYIYGSNKKQSNENLFNTLSYYIGIKKLIEKGFLCDYKIKCLKRIDTELESVKIQGDYNLKDLESIVTSVIHMESIVYAINDYCIERKKIVIFCTTIQHAKKLNSLLIKNNLVSSVIHSKMPLSQQSFILNHFRNDKLRILCNVGILTEGFDSPEIDCIIMDRATKSIALYIQMCGRGLRIANGKKDLLILDFANNCIEHGDIVDPQVIVPTSSGLITSDPVVKICDQCFSVISIGFKKCPECEYIFEMIRNKKEVINDKLQLHNYKDIKKNNYEKHIVSIETIDITKIISKAGNEMLKISLYCSENNNTLYVNEFLDIEGNASAWGYQKAISFWKDIVKTDYPNTVEEAMSRYGEIIMSLPNKIEIKQKNKWWNVSNWNI